MRAGAKSLTAVALAAATLTGAASESVAKTPAEGPRAHSSIIGGRPADPARWPFAVALMGRNTLCTGSVIAPTKVLTAAHCVAEPEPRNVIANRPTLRNGTVGEVIPVASVALHPDYATLRTHDLAVLTLASPTTAPPVTLATPAEEVAATTPHAAVRIAGFGQRNPFDEGSHRIGVLSAAQETIRTACRRLYRRNFSDQSMICALGKPFPRLVLSRSACFGDSGGPMIADLEFGPRLVGVASFVGGLRRGLRASIKCGFWKLPNVYTRVSDALPFITANL